MRPSLTLLCLLILAGCSSSSGGPSQPDSDRPADAGSDQPIESCGNGKLDPGETCDTQIAGGQPGSCPVSCDDKNSCTDDLLSSGGTCSASCTHAPITACKPADGCCPAGCTQAGGDSDCSSSCGDGKLDPKESCDTKIPAGQPGACPTDCDDKNPCTKDILLNGGSCSASCSHSPVSQCVGGDGCCPTGCNANSDSDCSASCGNGVLEPKESCDTKIPTGQPGACPTSCDDKNPCTTDTLINGGTCSASCSHAPVSQCTGGDGCCPAGCNAVSDADCSPSCGNGVLELNEGCDTGIPAGQPGACPTSCDDKNPCTTDTLLNGGTCSASCSHSSVSQCADGDGCCPAGCNANSDDDCSASCGNGVVEPGESCDTKIASGQPGACPASCDDKDPCTTDTLQGAGTCSASCSHSPVSQCAGGDGCCPAGCNAVSDADCQGSCGNGILEPGETCDTKIASGQAGACPTTCYGSHACGPRKLVGTGCQARCELAPITACVDVDGCCPPGCDQLKDSDCGMPDTCQAHPWRQYRSDPAHTGTPKGIEGSRAYISYNSCISWPEAGTTPPSILWTADLGGPVWNGPAIDVRDKTKELAVWAAATTPSGVKLYGLGVATGKAFWTEPLAADPKLDPVGLMSLTWQGDPVLSSTAGGLRLQTQESSSHLDWSQMPQSVPNAPVYFRWSISDPTRVHYLTTGGSLAVTTVYQSPGKTFGGVGSCVQPGTKGYAVGMLYDTWVGLFHESPSKSPGMTVFAPLSSAPTVSCSLLKERLWGIPVPDMYDVYYLTDAGELVKRRWKGSGLSYIWRRTVGAPVASPVIDRFGRVLLGAGQNELVSFSPEGKELWRVKLGAKFDSPAMTGYGTAIVGLENGKLVAVRDGKLVWSVQLSGKLTSPAISSQGIAVGSDSGKLWLLDVPGLPKVQKPGAPPLAYGPESIITRTIYSSSTTEKKETYTYDAQGRATVKTTYNKSGGAWQLSNRYEYTYDTSGKLTLAAYSYWSSGTSSWTETLRDAWSWGTHGPTNIDHSTNYTGSWKVTGKTIYEYDTAGRLSAMLKKGITTTGQFKLDSRKDFSYSADGRLGTLESGYDSSGTWKQNKPVWHAYLDGRLATISRSATSQRDVFAYLADGRIDRVVKDTYYTYSGPTGLTGKRVYTYDAQKRLEKVQTYAHDLKTDTWTLSGEVLITHTTAGSSHFFEQDPYPLRQWLIDWYGVGEPNRYATP